VQREGATDRRTAWERQWKHRRGEEFHWYLSEAPEELVRLVERADRPRGAALDVGCGNGVATAFLAGHFHPAVGLDIAHAATVQARDLAAQREVEAAFIVAEAPRLPFRDQSFGLVFDRGCLQAIPRQAWPTYFSEVSRLLAPGGMLQLYVSKPLRPMPKLLSARGLRARLRRRRGKAAGVPSFLTPAVIGELLPASMRQLELRQFDFITGTGTTRRFVYGLFQKA
jgi:SAM-dependent methyltransferase